MSLPQSISQLKRIISFDLIRLMYYSPGPDNLLKHFYDAQAGSVQCSACTSAFPSLRCQQTKSVSVSSVLSSVQILSRAVSSLSPHSVRSLGSELAEDNSNNSGSAGGRSGGVARVKKVAARYPTNSVQSVCCFAVTRQQQPAVL